MSDQWNDMEEDDDSHHFNSVGWNANENEDLFNNHDNDSDLQSNSHIEDNAHDLLDLDNDNDFLIVDPRDVQRASTAPMVLTILNADGTLCVNETLEEASPGEEYRYTDEYHALYYSKIPRDPRMPLPLTRRRHGVPVSGVAASANNTNNEEQEQQIEQGDGILGAHGSTEGAKHIVDYDTVTRALEENALSTITDTSQSKDQSNTVNHTEIMTSSNAVSSIANNTSSATTNTTLPNAANTYANANSVQLANGNVFYANPNAMNSNGPNSTMQTNVPFAHKNVQDWMSMFGNAGVPNSTLPLPVTQQQQQQQQQQQETQPLPGTLQNTLVEPTVLSKTRNASLEPLHPHPEWEYADVKGKIHELSKDQDGSRFVQKLLEKPENIIPITNEVLVHFEELATDVFGNYVLQKLFEVIPRNPSYTNVDAPNEIESSEQVMEKLISNVRGNLKKYAFEMYGCRVMQKALENMSPPSREKLVHELDDCIVECVFDQNANHVIQKIIEIAPDKCQHVIDAFLPRLKELACHAYGCRVLQRTFEECHNVSEVNIRPLLEAVMNCISEFTIHQYGNYVVQHGMLNAPEDIRHLFIQHLIPQVYALSCSKFASNVAEKVVTTADEEEREELIRVLTQPLGESQGGNYLVHMMQDTYANYVVQRFLESASEGQRKRVGELIAPFVVTIHQSVYGRHLLRKMESMKVLTAEFLKSQGVDITASQYGNVNEQGMLPGSHHYNAHGSNIKGNVKSNTNNRVNSYSYGSNMSGGNMNSMDHANMYHMHSGLNSSNINSNNNRMMMNMNMNMSNNKFMSNSNNLNGINSFAKGNQSHDAFNYYSPQVNLNNGAEAGGGGATGGVGERVNANPFYQPINNTSNVNNGLMETQLNNQRGVVYNWNNTQMNMNRNSGGGGGSNIMVQDNVNHIISSNNNNNTIIASDGSFLAPSQIVGSTSNNTFIQANANMNGNVNMIATPSLQTQQQVVQQPIQSFPSDQQYSAQIISIPTPMQGQNQFQQLHIQTIPAQVPQSQIITTTQPYYQTTQPQQQQQQIQQVQPQYIYQIAAPTTSIPGQPTQTQFYTSSTGNVIPFTTQGYPQFVSIQAPPNSNNSNNINVSSSPSSTATFVPNNQSVTPMTQYIQLTQTNPAISNQMISSTSPSSSSPHGAATATMYTTTQAPMGLSPITTTLYPIQTTMPTSQNGMDVSFNGQYYINTSAGSNLATQPVNIATGTNFNSNSTNTNNNDANTMTQGMNAQNVSFTLSPPSAQLAAGVPVSQNTVNNSASNSSLPAGNAIGMQDNSVMPSTTYYTTQLPTMACISPQVNTTLTSTFAPNCTSPSSASIAAPVTSLYTSSSAQPVLTGVSTAPSEQSGIPPNATPTNSAIVANTNLHTSEEVGGSNV